MKQLTGATRVAFLAFFASHIPITLLIDGQVILPAQWYPPACRQLVSWYSETFRDDLLTPPYDDVFFNSLVACELLFQLPFFFVAVYALLGATRSGGGESGRRADKPPIDGGGWFRSACIVYGAHTATTLVPILASIATAGTRTTMSQKAVLFGFYLPYLVFPLWLLAIAVSSEDVFGAGDGAVANGASPGDRTKTA